MTSRYRTIIVSALFLAAVAVHLGALGFHRVGHYNDDAWYVNAARWMAGTQDIHRNLDGHPIGYSVLMVPVAALSGTALVPFRIYSMFFFFGAVLLLYLMMKRRMDQSVSILLLILILLHPLGVTLSSDVMAVIPYMFLSLLAFYMAGPLLEKRGGILLLALVLSAAYYVKNQAAVLLVAFEIWLLASNRKKEALYLFFYWLLLVLPGFALMSRDPVDKYLSERAFTGTAGLFTFLKSFGSNLVYYINNTGAKLLFFRPGFGAESSSLLNPVFVPSAAGAGLLVILALKDREIFSDIPVALYSALYIMLQLLWVNVALRYLAPLYPFLIIYFFYGIRKKSRRLFAVIYTAALVSYLAADAGIIIASANIGNPVPSRVCLQTYGWIDNNTSEKDVLMTNYTARTFLYTGRKVVALSAETPDDLFLKCLENDAEYVCLFSVGGLQSSSVAQSPELYYRRAEQQLSRHPSRYRLVYRNFMEMSRIWKADLSEKEEFLAAWKIYREAMERFSHGDYEAEEAGLKRSIDIYPYILAPYSELAALYLFKDRTGKAMEAVARGLAIFPREPVLHALRGRIYMAAGKSGEAVLSWKEALRYCDRLKMDRLKRQIVSDMELTKESQ